MWGKGVKVDMAASNTGLLDFQENNFAGDKSLYFKRLIEEAWEKIKYWKGINEAEQEIGSL